MYSTTQMREDLALLELDGRAMIEKKLEAGEVILSSKWVNELEVRYTTSKGREWVVRAKVQP